MSLNVLTVQTTGRRGESPAKVFRFLDVAIVLVCLIAPRPGLAQPYVFPPVSDLPARQGLPHPLERIDGHKVADPHDWPEHRDYIKAMLSHYLYGTMPPKPDRDAVRWQVRRTRPAVAGKAVIENLEMTFTRGGRSASVRLAMLRPDRPGRFPVIIKNDRWLFGTQGLTQRELNYFKRHANWNEQQAFANEQAAERGYVLVKFMREDVATDARNRGDEGVRRLYPEYEDWGVIAAWAWAYQPIIDMLLEREDIDPDGIVVTGHSRGGKTALCAGIFDERIAITAPNSSGGGGTASWRYFDPEQEPDQRQTLKHHREQIPYWWSTRLMEFEGRENLMPFDAHTLRAAIAPRAFINTHARHDWWANPYGTALAHLAAQPVFECAMGATTSRKWIGRRSLTSAIRSFSARPRSGRTRSTPIRIATTSNPPGSITRAASHRRAD